MNQFEKIMEEVKTSSWQPQFYWEPDVNNVADAINLPHEDYPLNVKETAWQIVSEITNGDGVIRWVDACNIQKVLLQNKLDMIDTYAKNDPDSALTLKYLALPNLYISLGLRNMTVKVGKWTPLHPMFLNDLIEQIFPISFKSEEQIVQWYKIFQTIHPFNDLNGRVGGIIVAALSYNEKKGYLCRSHKQVVNCGGMV